MDKAGKSISTSRPSDARPRAKTANAPAPYGDDALDGHSLRDRLIVLHKRRYLAISVLLLVLVASLVRTYTTTPMYSAQARLVIEMEDERTETGEGAIRSTRSAFWQDPQPFYQTQYSILQGRELGARVVKRLNLNLVPEFATAGKEDEDALVGAFLSRVSVQPAKISHLVDVSFVSADPHVAARAVDALAEEYVQQNLEFRRLNMAQSLKWLSEESKKQQTKVEESERALAQYREDQNALSLENRQNIVVARLNQLNDAATRARMNRVQKESLYDQIKSLGPSVSADTIPAILQNPYIQSMKTRLADLESERSTLLERYGDKHPTVLKVNANIQDASRQLHLELSKATEAISNDYLSALVEERTLAAALEEQKAAAMDLNRKSVSYTVLEREAHSNRQVYEALLQREKELLVMVNSRGNNVRLMEHAQTPGAPFTPDPRRDLTRALVAGLVLALGLVFGLDYLDDTIKTPEDVTRKLKLPFLGMVPETESEDRPVLSTHVPPEFGEAFRSLRTSLVFSTDSESTRVVVITSAQPREGKTTTACNMGMALAFGGARVLLIDADMRRPAVDRVLALRGDVGLSQVLTGQATPRDVIQKLDATSLWVMPAGPIPPNPSELLGSDRMKALIKSLQRGGRFEWVIIDTPPLLAVTDAVILSPLAAGVALVIGSEMTHRRLVERAIETLRTGKPHILGAVLNRVDIARNKYYYARYHGYNYKNYYNKNYYAASPAAETSSAAGTSSTSEIVTSAV